MGDVYDRHRLSGRVDGGKVVPAAHGQASNRVLSCLAGCRNSLPRHFLTRSAIMRKYHFVSGTCLGSVPVFFPFLVEC